MSPASLGRAVERAFAGFEAQSPALQVATGIALGLAVTFASLGVFWLTLQVLVEYFQ